MSKFSHTSIARLDTCDERLRRVFKTVVLRHDCSILCGLRRKADQDEAFRAGKSTKRWPNSKHNVVGGELSRAVDVAPYPIVWDDSERFNRFAFYVFGVADVMGVSLRWGGNWDGDDDLADQSFYDLVHFEVR